MNKKIGQAFVKGHKRPIRKSKIARHPDGRVVVSCGGHNCTATDFTVDPDWRVGLRALDWRNKDGEWYCPLCLHTNYADLKQF